VRFQSEGSGFRERKGKASTKGWKLQIRGGDLENEGFREGAKEAQKKDVGLRERMETSERGLELPREEMLQRGAERDSGGFKVGMGL
jgi:hypothetical protein